MDTINDVTRRAEWCAVTTFFDRPWEEPGALIIDGDAGIGKTTFWLAACDYARRNGVRVLSARPVAAEAVLAYAAVADLLSGVEPEVWANFPDPQRRALDHILLRSAHGGTTADQRTLAAALLAVIEALAQRQRVLLAIDDLQWLDPSSALVISFVTRRLRGPAAVLATVRTGVNETRAITLPLPAPDATQRITLPPMRLGDLHLVVSRRLGRSIARPAMVRIHEVSGGNPFYAIELARSIQNGVAANDFRLAGTLSEVVRARLDGLRGDLQELLLAAACLGRPTVELLADALAMDAAQLRPLLEQAEAAGVLVLDGHKVRFSHPLLATGVTSDASAARRRDMHRRLAQIVTEPELQARHLAFAATHADPATLKALDTGAEIAGMRGAPAVAAELTDLAIGLGGDTVQRQVSSARNHFNAGDAATARAMLLRAIERDGPAPLRAEALHLLAMLSQFEDSLIDAVGYLERALDHAGDTSGLRVQILVLKSWIEVRIGRAVSSEQTVEAAVEDAERLGEPALLGQALSMSVVVHLLCGNGFDDGVRRRAPTLEGRATLTNAMALSWVGELAAASAEFEAVRRHCIEHAYESDLVFVSFHSVLNEIWRGDFARAALIAEDTVERARQLDGALQLSAAMTARAIVAAYAGHVDDARTDVHQATTPIVRSGSQLLTAWVVAALGFLEVSLGNYPAAVDVLSPLLPTISANATEIFVAGFVPDAVEALVQVGRIDDAEPLVQALAVNGRRLDRPWMLAVAERGRAMLLAAHGDLDGASAAATLAIGHHDRLAMPFERARTLLLLGQLQRRQRRKDASAHTIREALAVFEELQTPLWAGRARAELERSSVGRQRGAGLTPSEQRVAELAASGMTNRDVAAALFISPKTVEANLSRVYRKLAIHSRAELGQHMRR